MGRFRAVITFAMLSLPSISAAKWYRIQGESSTFIRIHADGQSMRIPVREVDLLVSALVLRHDTERPDWYWIEVTLPETRDSDGHLLVIDDRAVGQVWDVGGIYTRGDKWAVGFTSLRQARRCFYYLRTFHHLDAKHAHDATKA